MSRDFLHIDLESRSEIDLKNTGLDRYVNDSSTEILMGAWQFNDEDVQQWDLSSGRSPDKYLIEALRDPSVIKWAFNAQFERRMLEECWGIKSDYRSWRCTMVLAYMLGFCGTLGQIGRAAGFSSEKMKWDSGKDLINIFSKPQRITKAQPNKWRDWNTDPDKWEEFLGYNRQDVVAEKAQKDRFIRYPIPEIEWDYYAIDQMINDRGVMINRQQAQAAILLAEERKPQIIKEMSRLTKLNNPNSPVQLLPWLKERGYPFDDLRKDTVKKVIREEESGENQLKSIACRVLKMRLDASKTSIAKYKTMLASCGKDGRFRYSLQFYGAQRTGRWAGRRLQTQNLPRTPKSLEDVEMMMRANYYIQTRDMDGLLLLNGEPMDTLVGAIRSCFIPGEGKKFCVSDLSSIESVVIGWLTNCKWFLDTLHAGRDLYRSFASEWLNIPYEDTKPHRSKAKPATLGAGYRLGGGELLPDGKKTGLWAYGENMQVFMTQEESHSSVKAFRQLCPEIVQSWYALEKAVEQCIKTKSDVKVIRRSVDGEDGPVALPLTIEWRKPFLCILLPSGRRLYYKNPKLVRKKTTWADGTTTSKLNFCYMGKPSQGQGWVKLLSHGGKLIENIVQAIARDVLAVGMMRVEKFGTKYTHLPFLMEVVMHVHDELVTEIDKDADEELALNFLKRCMTKPVKWAPDLPLGAAGFCGNFYRKD